MEVLELLILDVVVMELGMVAPVVVTVVVTTEELK